MIILLVWCSFDCWFDGKKWHLIRLPGYITIGSTTNRLLSSFHPENGRNVTQKCDLTSIFAINIQRFKIVASTSIFLILHDTMPDYITKLQTWKSEFWLSIPINCASLDFILIYVHCFQNFQQNRWLIDAAIMVSRVHTATHCCTQ